ncbi:MULTISPECIES: hypothetical protein [Aminobacterium]|uniref:hypothetical protein n=1 Tax=Aminobacterium TaxID=81466 RepID=UPI00257F2145|nr:MULTISPECIES: hypothetical protein [unclassified Aminobacterium]
MFCLSFASWNMALGQECQSLSIDIDKVKEYVNPEGVEVQQLEFAQIDWCCNEVVIRGEGLLCKGSDARGLLMSKRLAKIDLYRNALRFLYELNDLMPAGERVQEINGRIFIKGDITEKITSNNVIMEAVVPFDLFLNESLFWEGDTL